MFVLTELNNQTGCTKVIIRLFVQIKFRFKSVPTCIVDILMVLVNVCIGKYSTEKAVNK